ncbi:MAG: RnfH family protein [Legionella sp.]
MVKIELIYCNRGQIIRRHITAKSPATVAQIIDLSKVYESYPETKKMSIGIFGKVVDLHRIVQHGDRIEFYHPLQIDPKDSRRQRAKAKKS